MVFGMISDRIRMASVIATGMMALVTQGLVSAQMAAAWPPTPMAPTVWAMVLSVRIAARGRSMLLLKVLRWRPMAEPCCF